MKTLELKQANATLGEYARHMVEETVIVTDGGRPIAALVSLREVDHETISLSLNPRFIALIEQSRARHEAEGGISSAEMRRRLGVASSRRPVRRTRKKK